MSFGNVNTPGAGFLKLRRLVEAFTTRVTRLEITLTGFEKVPGDGDPTAQTAGKVGQIYVNTETGDEWKCVSADAGGTTWEKQKSTGVALTAADVGAVAGSDKGEPGGVATLDAAGKVPEAQLPSIVPFVAGTSEPGDTKKFWIDTNVNTGGLKYYNGSAWVAVPVLYT